MPWSCTVGGRSGRDPARASLQPVARIRGKRSVSSWWRDRAHIIALNHEHCCGSWCYCSLTPHSSSVSSRQNRYHCTYIAALKIQPTSSKWRIGRSSFSAIMFFYLRSRLNAMITGMAPVTESCCNTRKKLCGLCRDARHTENYTQWTIFLWTYVPLQYCTETTILFRRTHSRRVSCKMTETELSL